MASGHVETKVFEISESFEPVTRAFAADARLLDAAEGDRRTGDFHTVDGDHAILQRAAHACLAGAVLGDDIGDEAVFGGVGAADDFGFVIKRCHGCDRSKSLFAHDQRVVRHIDEQRRLIEQRPGRVALAAGQAPRAVTERIGYLFLDFLDGALVHQRTDLYVAGEAAAGAELLDATCESGAEAVIDRSLHIDAVGGEAVLAGGGEFAQESGEWKNGVFTYAVLNGIKNNSADINGDGHILISELQDYVRATVIDLTHGMQKPTARNQNFSNDFRFW